MPSGPEAYGPHAPTLPTQENGFSSWFCQFCMQWCSSANPCDHCHDASEEWADAVD